jgi:FkbM family methyltransferase
MVSIVPLIQRLAPASLNRARYVRHAVLGKKFVYQHISKALFQGMGSQQMTAIDVGANLGIFTRYLSRHFGHTVAIEPLPHLAGLLRRSLPRDVTIERCALGNTDGEIIIRTPVSANGEHLDALTTASDKNDLSLFEHAGVHESSVPVRRLASLSCSAERIGIIKIDVEGFENEVLGGSDDIIRRDAPLLQVEISRAHNPDYLAFLDAIESMGYSSYTLHERHLSDDARAVIANQPLKMNDPDAANCLFDFLFVPADKKALAAPFIRNG